MNSIQKNIFIIGSTRGLGLEMANQLETGGHRVGRSGRSKLDQSNYYQLDVTNFESLKNALDNFFGDSKSQNVLVINAGVGPSNMDRKFNQKDFQNILRTNVLGLTYLMDIVTSPQKYNLEKVVIISSLSYIIPLDSKSQGYVESKKFSSIFGKMLKGYSKELGFETQVFYPSFIQTESLIVPLPSFLVLSSESAAKKIVKHMQNHHRSKWILPFV
jgi:short-subunit dehydrogenase